MAPRVFSLPPLVEMSFGEVLFRLILVTWRGSLPSCFGRLEMFPSIVCCLILLVFCFLRSV